MNRGITVGTSVDPSTTLLTIADLSRVWVLAEVPEASIPAIRVGSDGAARFPGVRPAAVRGARRLPLSDAHRAHAHAAGPLLGGQSRGALRPGLYGTAAFESTGQHGDHRAA